MKSKKLSVIIPIYNTSKYLQKCVSSVLEQTYSDLEVILVDDCSTDNSYEICRKMAFNDSRIILHHNNKNRGLSITRNIGMELASGSFITFVDSDDWIDIETYAKAMNYSEDYDIIGFNMMIHYRDDKTKVINRVENPLHTKKEIVKAFLFNQIDPSVCNKIFRFSLIDFNFDNNCIYEDNQFFWKLIKKSSNYYNINSPLYHYIKRKEENSLTDKQFGMEYLSFIDYANNVLKEVNVFYPEYMRESHLYYLTCLNNLLQKCCKTVNNSCIDSEILFAISILKKTTDEFLTSSILSQGEKEKTLNLRRKI